MKRLTGVCGTVYTGAVSWGGTRTGSQIPNTQLLIIAGNITLSRLGPLKKKKKATALCSKRNKNTSAKIRNCWVCQKEGREKALTNILPLVRAMDSPKPLLGTLPTGRRERAGSVSLDSYKPSSRPSGLM